MTLFYLGPKGTFSYLAALKLQSQTNQKEQLVERSNLYEVMSSLQKNRQQVRLCRLKILLKVRLM